MIEYCYSVFQHQPSNILDANICPSVSCETCAWHSSSDTQWQTLGGILLVVFALQQLTDSAGVGSFGLWWHLPFYLGDSWWLVGSSTGRSGQVLLPTSISCTLLLLDNMRRDWHWPDDSKVVHNTQQQSCDGNLKLLMLCNKRYGLAIYYIFHSDVCV